MKMLAWGTDSNWSSISLRPGLIIQLNFVQLKLENKAKKFYIWYMYFLFYTNKDLLIWLIDWLVDCYVNKNNNL